MKRIILFLLICLIVFVSISHADTWDDIEEVGADDHVVKYIEKLITPISKEISKTRKAAITYVEVLSHKTLNRDGSRVYLVAIQLNHLPDDVWFVKLLESPEKEPSLSGVQGPHSAMDVLKDF